MVCAALSLNTSYMPILFDQTVMFLASSLEYFNSFVSTYTVVREHILSNFDKNILCLIFLLAGTYCCLHIILISTGTMLSVLVVNLSSSKSPMPKIVKKASLNTTFTLQYLSVPDLHGVDLNNTYLICTHQNTLAVNRCTE